MKEVIDFYLDEINNSNILKKLALKKNNFFLLSVHREENVDDKDKLKNFFEILNFLDKKYKLPIIVSTHYRTKKNISKFKLKFNNCRFNKPFGFFDYLNLQLNSKLVMSDSGTITEESSILSFPAINLREMHERPEGMEEGAVIMAGLNIDKIENSIKILSGQKLNNKKMRIVNDYNVDNFSEKVARIVLSHIDFINKKVWNKYQ